MNGLSLISFFNGCSFIILGIYILKLNPKEALNRLAAMVNFCFAIWALTYTFFYTASTSGSAMFWHKAGSLGWIPYCVFAAHFFIILSERNKKYNKITLLILLYTLPLLLLLKTLLGKGTPVAKGMVQSDIGWGWTYISNISSIWFWLYILYTLVYFLISFYSIYIWGKNSGRLRFIKQVRSIIFLDVVMIVTGFVTDIISPVVSSMFPPGFNLVSIVWGVGFFYIVKTYKLMSVYDAASPDLILRTVMDPIIMLDVNGIIIACNNATQELFKYDMKHIINKPLSDFCISKEYGMQTLHRLFREKVVRNLEIDLLDSSGSTIHAVVSSSIAESSLDGILGIVLNVHDVTRLKKVEQELEKLAHYDKLTNLPNRRLFFTRLEGSIENYKKTESKFALVFMDLNGFKTINDSYGHAVGDMLLMKASDLFTASIKKQDFAARVGGDEFVILISDLQSDFELIDFTERLKEKFIEPIAINNISCNVGISLGISKCPEDGITPDELMKIADERMYADKSAKKI